MLEADPLDVRRVSKGWARTGMSVLDEVSLALPRRTLAFVEGANGAGKTTLLRIIAGILEPESGDVRVCGNAVGEHRTEYHRQIGLVTAGNAGLYARLNVHQHLSFAIRIALVARPRRAELVDNAIRRFALADFAGRRVDRLSMGQRQRLRLAMAFLHEPAVVLLDEPSTSLDIEGVGILAGAIDEHLRGGGSALWMGPTGDVLPEPPDLHLALVDGRLVAR
jgi:ABC-type multidrug transport system ATPase subunit